MIAYLDLPSGLSGDIFLGCLVDAGWPIEQLQFTLASLKLPADECSVHAIGVDKGALRATLVQVEAQEGHVHRRLADVRAIIDRSDLPSPVKERATAVFVRLAQAEAKVHGVTPDQIHFHEVGAVDAIADIVGVVTGLHEMNIEKLYASPVPLGSGWAKTAHGQIPLPAPATLELLAAAHAPTHAGPGPGELVTPTGAALLAELAAFQHPLMTLARIGMGAGQRQYPWPNVARLWLGEPLAPAPASMVQLETNIDDMNPQLYGAVSEKLFAAGARDVWFTPIQMKKNRPAVLLSALAPVNKEMELTQVILRETTTLGVRVHTLHHRHEVRREMRTVQTPHGEVRVKIKWIGHEALGAQPEYDDVKAIAERADLPTRQVYEAAVVAAHSLLDTLRKTKAAGVETPAAS